MKIDELLPELDPPEGGLSLFRTRIQQEKNRTFSRRRLSLALAFPAAAIFSLFLLTPDKLSDTPDWVYQTRRQLKDPHAKDQFMSKTHFQSKSWEKGGIVFYEIHELPPSEDQASN